MTPLRLHSVFLGATELNLIGRLCVWKGIAGVPASDLIWDTVHGLGFHSEMKIEIDGVMESDGMWWMAWISANVHDDAAYWCTHLVHNSALCTFASWAFQVEIPGRSHQPSNQAGIDAARHHQPSYRSQGSHGSSLRMVPIKLTIDGAVLKPVPRNLQRCLPLEAKLSGNEELVKNYIRIYKYITI